LSSRNSASIPSGANVFRVVIEKALEPLDVSDRSDGASADLPHPLCDRIGDGEYLIGLFVEK
jgi:hypothetical protein